MSSYGVHGKRPASSSTGGVQISAGRVVEGPTEDSDDVCVLCFKEMGFRCVMDCDHVICHECATRLRVLCDKLECPICRQQTTMAVFTEERGRFEQLYRRALHFEDRYKLAFDDETARHAYSNLLAHVCPVCSGSVQQSRRAETATPGGNNARTNFGTFKQLQEHVRRDHQLFYCNLCVEHLSIFTNERKVYTKEKLALHRRKGDADNSSHRGHPNCEFCDVRYLDKEALFIHLRRDHFICHICEIDERLAFYDNYEELEGHFRDSHFLCEYSECLEKRFMVFSSMIDIQAHRASSHSENKSRQQQRQDRVVTVELFGSDGRRRRPDRRDAGGDTDIRLDCNGVGDFGRSDQQLLEQLQQPPQRVPAADEFPSLQTNTGNGAAASGGASWSGGGGGGNRGAPPPLASRLGQGRLNIREFPTLGGNSASSQPSSAASTASSSLSVNVRHRGPATKPGRSRQREISVNVTRRSNAGPNQQSRYQEPEQPRITQVSSTSNITMMKAPVSSAVPALNGARALSSLKSAFPTLVPPSRSSTAGANTSWTPRSEPSQQGRGGVNAEPARPSSSGDTKPKLRLSSDFPTLAPVSQHGNLRNFSGTNSVKFNMSKAKWKAPDQTTTAQDAASTSASSGNGGKSKGKMKKVGPTANGNLDGGSHNRNGPPFSEGRRDDADVEAVVERMASTQLSFSYQQPDRFEARNRKLVNMMQQVFSTPESFDQFKIASAEFRCGALEARDYYRTCLILIGNDKFGRIFAELLVLLPDIAKQTELLEAHQVLNKNGFQRNKFLVCPVCQQILVFADFAPHTSRHCQDDELPIMADD